MGILEALGIHYKSSSKWNKFAKLVGDEQNRRTAAGEPPIQGDEWKDWYHSGSPGEPRWELLKTGGPIKNRQRRNRPRSDSAPGGWHQNPNPGGSIRPRHDPSLNRFTGEPLAWERTREGRREVARQAEERRRRQHQQQQPRNGHRNRERVSIPQQGHDPLERDPARPRIPRPARDPVPIPQSRREPQAPEPAPASEAPASAPQAAGGRHNWRPDETVGRASNTVRFRMPGPTEGRTQQTTMQQPQRPQPSRTAVGGGAVEQPPPAPGKTSQKGPGGLFGWGLGPMDAPGPPAPTVVQPRPRSGSDRRR